MTKVKKFFVGTVLFCLLVVTAIASIPALSKTARAANVQWSNISIQEEYLVGELLSIPSRTVTVDGTQVSSDVYAMLTLPDGQRIMPKGEYPLEQVGKYTLSYTVSHNNINYKDEVVFRVYSRIASVTTDNSSFSYGSNPYMKDYDANDPTKGNKGLNVKLVYGDTLKFDSIIDLNGKTKNDSIMTFLCTPQKKAKKDIAVFMIRLTDITDSNNYLQIKIHSSGDGDDKPSSYFLAGGNGQAIKGYEEYWNRLHVNNEWGTPIRHSFQGDDSAHGAAFSDNEYLDDTPMNFSYDSATNAVYVWGANNAEPILCMDFDDPKYYGKNVWSGFKSGKVKLSVWCDEYDTDSSWFCITKVMDTDVSKDKAEDNVKPTITIQYPQNDKNNIPKGKVGFYYPIFDIFTHDNYFNVLEEEVTVSYINDKGNPRTVTIDDGRFLIDKAGKYRVDWTVTDGYGNFQTASEFVYGYDVADVPEVSLSIPNASSSIYTGERIDIQQATYSGGSGELTLKYSYSYNGGDRVSINKNGFAATKAGTYEIFYTVTDYIGQVAEKSETVTVTNSDKPVFGELPVLPRAIISDYTYYLDDFYASYYSGDAEPVQVLASAQLIDNNGATDITKENGFVATWGNVGSSVTIRYTATYNGQTNSKDFVVPVILNDQWEMNMVDFFTTEGVALSAKSDNITVTANESNGSFGFVNSVLDNEFAIELGTNTGKTEYQGIKFTLTDSRNDAIKVSAIMYNRDIGTVFTAQGQEITLVEGTGILHGTQMTFAYESATKSISLNGNMIAVTLDDDGEKFNGFPSGKVYIDVSFVNANTLNSSVQLISINKQLFSNDIEDRFAPLMFITEDLNYTVDRNAFVKVPLAVAGDVFSPNVTFTVTVKDNNGAVVSDVNGLALNNVPAGVSYTFKVTNYGVYSITFTYSDGINSESRGPAVNVQDSTPPEIIFSQDFKTEITLGENIIIPNFSVSDNNTASNSIETMTYIRTSDGQLYLISGTNGFTPKYTGVYQILISAKDGSGNVNLLRQNITVK